MWSLNSSRKIYASHGISASEPGCNSEGFLVIFYVMTTQPLQKPEQDDEVLTQDPAKVILFNDDIHTFDEVITQLVKATRCSAAQAEALAMEVHTKGRAVVFAGELARCMEVSGILEEIEVS